MRQNLFVIILAVSAAAGLSACGGPTPNTNAGNSNTPNVNAPSNNNPLATTTATPAPTTNNAPTLTPVYKAYCTAMVKKDEAGLRKVFSSDTIKFVEGEIKADHITPPTLVKYFEDEQVTLDVCEVRNEQITGDQAVAEVRTKGIPNGVKVIFVKENGEWKLTNRFPTLDSVKSSATNSNAAKK